MTVNKIAVAGTKFLIFPCFMMKKVFMKKINHSSKLFYFLRKMRFNLHFFILLLKYIKNKRFNIKNYPKGIQLPITYKCNFDCVMCGMRNLTGNKDFTAEELGEILDDNAFKKIEVVGVNGGEPFLKNDIIDCFKIMLEKLPRLKVFNMISNGYFTDKTLQTLKTLKSLCETKHVKLNLSISIDGIGDLEDFHRGCKNAFKNAETTCKAILLNKCSYVDYLNIICTITKYNISRINEVEVWAKRIGIDVSYNIATENVRIANNYKYNDFSIFNDEHARMLTREFFYKKYHETRELKYFGLYLFVNERTRYADCPCKYNDWITVTPNGQIGFCATHSKNIGSGLEQSTYDLIEENKNYLKEIRNSYCEQCSHYMYSLNLHGIKKLYTESKKNSFLR